MRMSADVLGERAEIVAPALEFKGLGLNCVLFIGFEVDMFTGTEVGA